MFVSSRHRKNPKPVQLSKYERAFLGFVLARTQSYIDKMDMKWGLQIDFIHRTILRLAEAREEIKGLEIRDAHSRHDKLGCCSNDKPKDR